MLYTYKLNKCYFKAQSGKHSAASLVLIAGIILSAFKIASRVGFILYIVNNCLHPGQAEFHPSLGSREERQQ